MDFGQVKQLIDAAGVGYLATATDDGVPKVRPMAGCVWVDGELWCASFLKTDKVDQIQANPQVEFCFMDPQWNHVRIGGDCRISTDTDDRRRIYGLLPELAEYVQGAEDPKLAVLRTTVGQIRAMTSDARRYVEVPLEPA